MKGLSPADELAEIRAEIARLRLREVALKAAFLQKPTSVLTGRWHQVEIMEYHSRVFDAALLPRAIREDPRFCRAKVVQVVHTRALPPSAPRPGWPIRRDAGLALH